MSATTTEPADVTPPSTPPSPADDDARASTAPRSDDGWATEERRRDSYRL